ncbi:hypothetical protein [Methanoculleus frigidifontis]|uniref:hypothetical protein n=1 Tax=Methanoculleus frigidifontis TaxID=2584085 RepID=UPI0026588972|nr:hypothetical protein [Methanoculleus sp. FWC-SCC1]
MPTSAEFIEGSDVSIGHLGIFAGAFDTLGIAGVIDCAIPPTVPLIHNEAHKN